MNVNERGVGVGVVTLEMHHAMLAFTASIVAYQGAAPAPRPVAAAQRTVQPTALELDGLKELASKQNPVLGYYDPLNLASSNFWGDTDAATIGWLRHAEIKHGRVAMFGFVGYIVHEYGLRWGMPLSPNVPMSTFDGMSAPAIWEALPIASKWQIVFFVGLLEIHSEGERNSGAILRNPAQSRAIILTPPHPPQAASTRTRPRSRRTARSTTCAAASRATSRRLAATSPTSCSAAPASPARARRRTPSG